MYSIFNSIESNIYLFSKYNPNKHTAMPAAFVMENDSLYKKYPTAIKAMPKIIAFTI